MASDSQRTNYSGKSETGQSKSRSSGSLEMTKGGGSGDGSGPTSSSRSYPKGGKPSMSPDFNPMKDKRRGGTDWAVGGVGN